MLLPELDALLALQRQDTLLFDAKRKREEIPRRLDSLRDAVNRSKSAHEESKKQVEQARLARRAIEKEVEGVGAEALKLERQLADVKTNKEYQALLHEIVLLKTKRSDYETKILESFEREEALAVAVAAAERQVKAEETRLREGEAELARESAELDQTLHSITQDRDAVKPRVPAPLLSRYDRLLNARDGIAVAEVRKGACGACFKALTPHAIQNARRGDQIQICESCGRIMIWVEASAS